MAESAARIEDGALEFQLAYGDCDAVGIAYFAIYYRWMERCYTTWLYSHGLRGGELIDDVGVMTVGLNSSARYLQTVRVFDALHCQAVAERIGTTSYAVGFEFTRDGQLVTKGVMTFAVRDPGSFGKAPIPEPLARALSSLPAPRFAVE
ncbi:acyl-CoA thioesterase [Gordonia caeni]|uniref:Acyl-CoA thioesterase n=1 Tax=Gordonia caeni TaxID=1007097 RepID=A0ABP7NQX9_9ACTN